ncbi:MAG: hypothetical protein JNK28_09465 [Burkholderiaceae bacterium]|nr:hypothetical protein [Burkholderiaceae bacterium]
MDMTVDGDLILNSHEWDRFQQILGKGAVWKPRTEAEFNAMCDLAAATYEAEAAPGANIMALACRVLKFDNEGNVSPALVATEQDQAFLREYGQLPDEQQRDDWTHGRKVKLRPPPPAKPRIRFIKR